MWLLPAVAGVHCELLESFMKGVNAVNDEVYRRRLLSLPSFGDEKEGFEDRDGASDELPLGHSEG